ncbi:hypothetical protein LTR44_003499 [Exophiala sp. CCFEE 6388]|nr:hypothetical protein LTR44_003499 [Eurotiomycetes sp. CCFEE 6388]
MSSYPGLHTQPQHSDNNNMLLQQEAKLRATLIRETAKTIRAEQRGVTAWTSVKFEDLPSSTELMSGAHDSATIFQDALTARTYHDVLLPNKQPEDSTIPTDDTILRAHVKVLFKAFKSVPEDAEEGEEDATKENKKAREEEDKTKRPFVNQVHDNHLVESLCWKILETVIYRSKKDQNLVEAWEPGKLKGKKTSFSFAERFDKVVQTMIESKSICKHLFDVDYMFKIVDDPVSAIKRVIANKRLNGKKAELMKLGKGVSEDDGKKTAKRTLEHDDYEEAASDARPAKTRRRTLAVSPGPGQAQSGLRPTAYTQSPLNSPASYPPALRNIPRSDPGHLYDTAPSRPPSSYPDFNMLTNYRTHAHTPPSRGLGISGLDATRSAPQFAGQLRQPGHAHQSGYSGLPSYLPPNHPQSFTRSLRSSANSSTSTPPDHGTVQQWPMAAQADNKASPYYQQPTSTPVPRDNTAYLDSAANTEQAWNPAVTYAPSNDESTWAHYQAGDDLTQHFVDDYSAQPLGGNDSEYTEDIGYDQDHDANE